MSTSSGEPAVLAEIGAAAGSILARHRTRAQVTVLVFLAVARQVALEAPCRG